MYGPKKKIGKLLTSKSVGTGPSSYEKNNLLGRGLTNVEKHCLREHDKFLAPAECAWGLARSIIYSYILIVVLLNNS